MLFQKIVFMFCIACGTNHIIIDESFTFVFDRSLVEIVNENASNRTRVYLRDDIIRSKQTDGFIWDKNLPKPVFYRVEFRNLTKSTLKTELVLKCLSGRKEELCRFKIEYDSKNFTVHEIYCTLETVKTINEESKEELILSSDKKTHMTLRNSLDYLCSVESIRSLYYILLGRFCDYIEDIHLLNDQVAIHCSDKAIYQNVWDVEKHAIEMAYVITKSLASLRIPSLLKMEFTRSNDYFLQHMEDLSAMTYELLYTLEAHFQKVDTPKGDHDVAMPYNRFYRTAMTLLIIPNRGDPFSYENIYKRILNHLQSVDDKNKKNSDCKNTQITLDCDLIKLDKFVKKYASLLSEYCNLMVNCDEVYLTAYYFSKNCNDSDLYLSLLEETFADILIAKKLVEYLHIYEHDKTDFLIFSQTEYFKDTLSFTILTNLEALICSIEFKISHSKNVQGKDEESLSKENGDIIKLKDLKKRWVSIIDPYNDGSIKSFLSILNSMTNLLQNEPLNEKFKLDKNQTNNVGCQTNEEDIKKSTEDATNPKQASRHTFKHKERRRIKPMENENSEKQMKPSNVMSNTKNIKISSVHIFKILAATLWLILGIVCYTFSKRIN